MPCPRIHTAQSRTHPLCVGITAESSSSSALLFHLAIDRLLGSTLQSNPPEPACVDAFPDTISTCPVLFWQIADPFVLHDSIRAFDKAEPIVSWTLLQDSCFRQVLGRLRFPVVRHAAYTGHMGQGTGRVGFDARFQSCASTFTTCSQIKRLVFGQRYFLSQWRPPTCRLHVRRPTWWTWRLCIGYFQASS